MLINKNIQFPANNNCRPAWQKVLLSHALIEFSIWKIFAMDGEQVLKTRMLQSAV